MTLWLREFHKPDLDDLPQVLNQIGHMEFKALREDSNRAVAREMSCLAARSAFPRIMYPIAVIEPVIGSEVVAATA